MTSLVALRDEIAPHISAIPDFPKKGILFRDIMPLFRQPQLVDKMCRAIAAHVREKYGENGVDAVAALDARGFLFGPYVAILLNVPFVPMRKSGKLPGQVISASYKKEYGEDIVEMQAEALKAGQRVLLLDDLLATGGTLRAALQLVEKVGARVVEAFVLIELSALKGRAVLPPECTVEALIKYDD